MSDRLVDGKFLKYFCEVIHARDRWRDDCADLSGRLVIERIFKYYGRYYGKSSAVGSFTYGFDGKNPRCFSDMGKASFSITASMSSHTWRFTLVLPPL